MSDGLSRRELAELLQTRVTALEAETRMCEAAAANGGSALWPVEALNRLRIGKLGSLYEVMQLAMHLGINVRARAPIDGLEPHYPSSKSTEAIAEG